MTRVVITGAKGQMGKTLIACATRIPDLQITGQIDLGDKIEPLLGVVTSWSISVSTMRPRPSRNFARSIPKRL